MDMPHELVVLERQGWDALTNGTAPEFYDRVMTPDAQFVAPGMVVSRDEVLEEWKVTPPWRSYELRDEQVVPLADGAALVTYFASARRADGSLYEAQFTSVYVRDEGVWKLAFHQQTMAP